MAEPCSLENYVQDLRRIGGYTDDEDGIIRHVGPLAKQMALEKSWLRRHHYDCDTAQGFTAHLLYEEPDHTLAVFVVSWLPGHGAPPHDHGTWVVVAGVEGNENNIRYRGVEDRTRSGYAVLELKHALDDGKHINFSERSQFDLETNRMKDFKILVQ